MSVLRLTLACGDYDLLRPVIEGTVRPQGVALTVLTMASPERHWRMLRHEEFDVCELSMASYLADRCRKNRFVAIPVFPHRRFRHSYIFVYAQAGIQEPKDLEGRRVGLRTFQTTAGLWARGILQHEYGVTIDTVEWLTQDEEDVPLGTAPRLRVQRIPPDKDIDQMVRDGEVDAAIYPDVLPSFRKGHPEVRRLFADAKAEEIKYFQRTGIFPIMHTVVLKRDIVDRFPWAAANLWQAFEAAKGECYRRLRDPRRVSLAWAMDLLEEQERILGPDPWTYGLEPNRRALETLLTYAQEQGLTDRRLKAEELFAPSTLDRTPGYLG
jgi:4,5-dihydroxyphthalate decarboxylase